MRTIRIAIAAALLACAGVAAAQEPSLKAVIQALENDWSAAYNANDAERVGMFYEEDAILIPPGSPPAVGRAAIVQVFSGLFPVLQNVTLITDEVRPLGENYAVEIGRSTYQAVAEDGSTTPGGDDYQVVWHKGADGKWRYVTDMFNSRS